MTIFAVGSLMIVLFMVPGFFLDGRWWPVGALFAFLGGIFGALFVVSLGDGTLTTAYAYSGGFLTATGSDAALVNAPIFLTLMSFAVCAFRGIRH